MQRISRAPVLSATRSRDSCWITSTPVCLPVLRPPSRAGGAWRNLSLAGRPVGRPVQLSGLMPPPKRKPWSANWCSRSSLGLLEDLHDAPALGGRQRTGLHQEDTVADAAGVLLV